MTATNSNSTGLTRRNFLAGSAAAAAVAAGSGGSTTLAQPTQSVNRQDGERKRIALIGTEVRKHSHAQHFVDRFLFGYGWGGSWRTPEVDLVSLYIDQFPDGDLARSRAERFGVPIYPSIAEALTCGGSDLAVDGVVIIGEHGRYPRNEMGQTRYPRYKFFKEVIDVFESSGRSVPVFNDKHLSTKWDECVEMVEDSKRLGFPFLAGSSLPVTWRLPPVDVPFGSALKESVCVCYGGPDSYDFHGYETAQCMSERRRGGEVGIEAVQALRGAAMWDRLASREHSDTRDLLVSALIRSQSLPEQGGFMTDPVSFDWARRSFPNGWANFVEHRDGFRTTMLILPPISDFCYAGLDGETGEVTSCMMYLPMPGRAATTADFFNPLVRHIETMIVEERAPYPVERTLLTSGMTMAGVESLFREGERITTPEMAVEYTAPRESLFWRT